MPKVAIIGKGNVGSHLLNAFRQKGIETELIDSRSLEGIYPDFDFIILTVSDSIIPEVAAKIHDKIPEYQGIVCHTAGSVEMKAFAPYFENYGVLYPLRSFTKDLPIENYQSIPVYIEGSDDRTLQKLKELSIKVFDKVTELSSAKREKLHIASVFACNFSNAMYVMAEEILQSEGMAFEDMHNLITQSMEKALNSSPAHSQTGPARRGDKVVIDRHFEELSRSNPKLSEIYKILSDYIYNKYHN